MGEVGTPPNCRPAPPEECPVGEVGTPPNCRPAPPEECPAGEVGTPPNCRALTLDERQRLDAGLDKVAVNGVFPANHQAIVKPQFAVVEASTARWHGGTVQAAACLGYAPGGCEVARTDDAYGYSVSSAPFIYIEPPQGNNGGVFQDDQFAAALARHPHLKVVSMSIGMNSGQARAIGEGGVVFLWGAGNTGVADFREANSGFSDEAEGSPDSPYHGNAFLRQLENDGGLLVAGYDRDDSDAFVPHADTTQCGGVDGVCLYAPFEFVLTEGGVTYAGTSLSAPFVAAGLASVLAAFPETEGRDLIRLAKRCAVPEPGLRNGLGRFSLACMDNSPIFHLDRPAATEETAQSVRSRHARMQRLLPASLPGSARLTVEVEGVGLARDIEGDFSYRSGLATPPAWRGGEGAAAWLDLFHDHARGALGVRIGGEDVFLAGSWATHEPAFFGHGGYAVESFNAAAGTERAFLRWSRQSGERQGESFVGAVRGDAIGATLTHTFATPLGVVTPFVHADRFEGGRAATAAGDLRLRASAWSREAGVTARTTLSKSATLSVTAAALHSGDRDTDTWRAHARLGVRF